MFSENLFSENCVSLILIIQLFISVFFAILFLQSGLDKLFDWKGNFQWMSGYFEKSSFKNLVAFMLGTITIFEIGSGIFSFLGIFGLVFWGNALLSIYGLLFSGISILCLFFGQRMAKDYSGAASLVPYFILVIISLYFFV